MRLALYCACGAAWTGDVAPSFADKAMREFNELHRHPECGPATAEEATRARAQAKADEARLRLIKAVADCAKGPASKMAEKINHRDKHPEWPWRCHECRGPLANEDIRFGQSPDEMTPWHVESGFVFCKACFYAEPKPLAGDDPGWRNNSNGWRENAVRALEEG